MFLVNRLYEGANSVVTGFCQISKRMMDRSVTYLSTREGTVGNATRSLIAITEVACDILLSKKVEAQANSGLYNGLGAALSSLIIEESSSVIRVMMAVAFFRALLEMAKRLDQYESGDNAWVEHPAQPALIAGVEGFIAEQANHVLPHGVLIGSLTSAVINAPLKDKLLRLGIGSNIAVATTLLTGPVIGIPCGALLSQLFSATYAMCQTHTFSEIKAKYLEQRTKIEEAFQKKTI